MDEFESRLHRTWVASLIEFNFRELAAIAIDFNVILIEDSYGTLNDKYRFIGSIILDIPIFSYQIAQENIDLIKRTFLGVCHGHIQVRRGGRLDINEDELGTSKE